MLVDRVKVFVKGGKGGNGAASFRREKYVPKGGPDGGPGGNGGCITFVATSSKSTLLDLSYRPHLKAENGEHGSGGNKKGKDGNNLYVEVPLGTVIKDEDEVFLADLDKECKKVVAARRGRGGRGNASFTSSKRQAPKFAERGEKGEERTLILELKLLADVGLVGFPNAGKSTLLTNVSSASPQIAEYPFTTLSPKLGVVFWEEERSFVIADLPGLIKDAHKGSGLGHRFLRHIERTTVLLFLIDMAAVEERDPYEDYVNLKEELQNFNPELLNRPFVIAANKMDISGAEENLLSFKFKIQEERPVFPISAATGEGLAPLLQELYTLLETSGKYLEEEEEYEEQDIEYLPPVPQRELSIEKEGNIFIVKGTEVEKTVERADLTGEEGLIRFQKVMEQLGVEDKLRAMGIKDGDTVRIADKEFTYYE